MVILTFSILYTISWCQNRTIDICILHHWFITCIERWLYSEAHRVQAMEHEFRPVQLRRVWWACFVVRARCRLGAADIAYDFRWDFNVVGRGNRSSPYTDVLATIARQHSSWRLSTVRNKKNVRNWKRKETLDPKPTQIVIWKTINLVLCMVFWSLSNGVQQCHLWFRFSKLQKYRKNVDIIQCL